MPWLDASIATCSTPAAARAARRWCSATGSGVVSPPFSVTEPVTPSVPTLTALWPDAAKIWRVNSATDVLPAVPVTATMVSGCRPASAAAISARRRRGSASCTTTGASMATPVSHRIAAAPFASASGTKAAPSKLVPLSAANIMPGRTARLSAVMPVISTSAPCAGSATSSPSRTIRYSW